MKPFAHVEACHVSLHATGCLVLTSYVSLSFLPYGPVQAGTVYGLVMGCFVLLVNISFILSVLWKLYKMVGWKQLLDGMQASTQMVLSKVARSGVVSRLFLRSAQGPPPVNMASSLRTETSYKDASRETSDQV